MGGGDNRYMGWMKICIRYDGKCYMANGEDMFLDGNMKEINYRTAYVTS